MDIILPGIRPEDKRTVRSVVTIDETDHAHHVCFSHVPTEYELEPDKSIRQLAQKATRILDLKPKSKPTRFYVHIPAECSSNGHESFSEAKIKAGLIGKFSPITWEHHETIPAGLHKSIIENYSEYATEFLRSEVPEIDAYRRFTVKSLENELRAG